jgi:hypothetical protein
MNGRLDFGATVHCTDGDAGELTGVVIEEDTRRLTHLVVRSSSRHARLVPLALVASSTGKEVALACSSGDFAALTEAHGSAYVGWDEEPGVGEGYRVGVEDVTALAYPDLGEMGGYVGEIDSNVVLTYDRVPAGCVELRGSSAVLFGDGHHLGHLTGWIVRDDRPAELVLARGHLWGTREISIPVREIASFDNDVVRVALTVDQLDELPSTRTHRLFD